MNRLLAEAAQPKGSFSITRLDPAVNRTAFQTTAPHALFAPLHYEPNYAYPLVVWLHGEGGNERQLLKVMPHVSMRNYVAAGVRGILPCADRNGHAWEQSESCIAAAEQRVHDVIGAAAARFHVNSARVFLAGYEAGGTMALRLALRNPRRFAGAASIGGGFPTGGMPLANLYSLRSLPLLLAYARDSATYSLDEITEELPLFHSAGLKMNIRQYPCGDELTTQMLSDLDAWMMEQVTGIPASCDEVAVPVHGDWN